MNIQAAIVRATEALRTAEGLAPAGHYEQEFRDAREGLVSVMAQVSNLHAVMRRHLHHTLVWDTRAGAVHDPGRCGACQALEEVSL